MKHIIQDYSECCIRCGMNIWDENYTEICSGGKP